MQWCRVDTNGLKAFVEGGGDEGAGRSFASAELNWIFAHHLFSGCAGEDTLLVHSLAFVEVLGDGGFHLV